MNFYPFHIGDYASATRHLSWDEDCAYRRLLDVYYTTEKPLPLDMKQVCRLAVASTKAQRDAIAVVLEEFFERTDAGWINSRADEEIDAMRIKQAAGEEKAAHEAGRMSRYRERRAAIFQALRAVGVVPSWDVPMKDLQRLFDKHCNAKNTDPATPPETHLQREQVVCGDAPATAIPIPTPTPISSIPNGMGGEPPKLAPDEIVFGYGVPLLVNAGTPEKQARSFLGMLRKRDEAALINALRDCLRAKPLQPMEWLAAAMPPDSAPSRARPGKHAGFKNLNYREGVTADGSLA